MNYLHELKQDNAVIHERLLAEIDERFDDTLLPISSALDEDKSILKEYVAKPGRGIGGSLVLRMAGIYGPLYDHEGAMRVAAATELQNAGILIIDDWMDKSAFRKGQPTVHEEYATIERNRHVANSRAVQLGLLAVTMAADIASGGDYVNQQQLVQNMSKAQMQIMSGQMLESMIPNKPKLQHGDSIASVYANKTGIYSFGAPIESGLLIADAPPETIKSFRNFSRELGIGFQISDDMMGLFGNPEVTGKPNDDDIKNGVYTSVYDMVLRKVKFADGKKERLQELYGKPGITDAQIAECREILGGLNRGIAGLIEIFERNPHFVRAQGYLHQALKAGMNQETQEYLRSMLRFFWEKDRYFTDDD